ncbi:serine hydroxymethyltransferase [Streptomyces cinerochromogenes]|uniref:serine hydroxymethyltransferase n=1 Tax=Streptomyces cinerochromogenes TaxID=66422 RepID=UPI00368C4606
MDSLTLPNQAGPAARGTGQRDLTVSAAASLRRHDPELDGLLEQEFRRQQDTLAMVAYASLADPSVLACGASVLANVTAEGYPGARYHPGCRWLDQVEELAVRRTRAVFGARYANVQPHSCSQANLSVLFALMRPGDTVLGLALDAGGHLTHGAPASVVGDYFHAVGYGVGEDGRIDYGQLRRLAHRYRPKVVIAGASAYPRALDYERFRAVADEVGAYLLADISHIAGLVAAGVHPSPIDLAHITTLSTYKQLGGPRGGLILSGAECDTPGPDGVRTLAQLMQRAVFPRSQGTLNAAGIAAKARALALVARPEFRDLAERIVGDARALAEELTRRGHRVLTGGTDTHMVLVDTTPLGLSGAAAERALEECGILANRNRIPNDTRSPRITSGLRFGTNILAQRGLGPKDMGECADLVHQVLTATEPAGGAGHRLDPVVRDRVRRAVHRLCRRHPLPGYTAEPAV